MKNFYFGENEQQKAQNNECKYKKLKIFQENIQESSQSRI